MKLDNMIRFGNLERGDVVKLNKGTIDSNGEYLGFIATIVSFQADICEVIFTRGCLQRINPKHYVVIEH